MKIRTAIGVISVLGAAALAAYHVLKPVPEDGKKGPAEQHVGVVGVNVRDVPVVVEVNGAVVSLKAVDVRAQTSNLVRTIHVKEGQFVRQGELLFSLDDRADRANLEKARAQLARDRSLAADLDRQHRRAEDLKAQNFLSQSAVDTTSTQREAQLALVRSDEAAVAAAQVALDYDTIRAPQAGRLGAINVFPGSLVQPGGTPLVTVTQLDPIAVQFNVPESSLQALQQVLRDEPGKANVRVRIPATGQDLTGRLYFSDNTVDTATGTIKTKAVFANPDNVLWPGQFVPVRIELNTLKGALTIPAAAVITGLSGKFVYALAADGTVQPKPIKVRHTFGDSMVVEGVSAQDRIVLDGKQNLRPGVKVRVMAPQATGVQESKGPAAAASIPGASKP